MVHVLRVWRVLRPQELARFRDGFSTSDLDVVRMKHETYDTLCLRYLRARKFDHEAATTMLRESIVRAAEASFARGAVSLLCV